MSKQPIGRFIVILGPQAYKDDFVERGLYKLHCWRHRNISKTPKKQPKTAQNKKEKKYKMKIL